MRIVLSSISSIISVYVLLCVIRILMSWIPPLAASRVGRFLCLCCDPYLNLFRRIGFLHVGPMDFSPVLAVGILLALSSALAQTAVMGIFKIGIFLSTLLGVCWSVAASLTGFLIILIIIRLVLMLFRPDARSDLWQAFDRALYPALFGLTGLIFGKQKYVQFRTALLIGLLALCLIQFAGGALIRLLLTLIARLPV